MARAPSPRQIAWIRVVFPEPSSPENPHTAGAASAPPRDSPNALRSSALRRTALPVSFGAQIEDLVAQHGGELEVELLGGRLHLALEQLDQRLALLGVGGELGGRAGVLRRARVGEARGEA